MDNLTAYLPPSEPYREIEATRFEQARQDREEATGFSFSVSDLLTVAWRRRWLLVSAVAIALVLGVVVTLLITPIYQATATVQIRQEATNILSGQDVNPTDAVFDSGRYLKTQEQIISSQSMATRVMLSAHLADNDTFLQAMGKKIDDTVPVALRPAERRKVVVEALTDNLIVKVPLDSRIATINFVSPNPRYAALVAQSYADNYIQNNIDTAFRSTGYARQFLSDQVKQARERLTLSEQRAINYARGTQLIDASNAAASDRASSTRSGSSLTTASLVKLNEQLGEARSARIEAVNKWEVARATPLMNIPEVMASATISGFQQDRSTAQQALLQLRARYTAEHPEVQGAAARVRSIDAQIIRQATQIRDSLKAAATITAATEERLQQAVGAMRGDVLSEQQRRVELNVLSQDVEINRTTLADLLKRYNEVNAAAGITANNLSLVDGAEVPESPIRPRPIYNIGIALLLGMVAGLALAVITEAVDDMVRSPEDVEKKLHQAMLGTTPRVKTQERLSMGSLSDPTTALSESYFSIRVALDHATSHGRPRTIMVTSSAPAEGKSTTSLALGLDYARIGLRTLLIDADLRRPSIHRMAGLPNKTGLADLLLGHKRLQEAIQNVPESALDIITLGKIPPNPVQVLSGDAFPRLIAEVSARYDIVIIDTSPVMGIADAPLLSRMVEGVVVVVEAGRAHRGQAKATLKRIRKAGGAILGVVLSKFDSRDAGYGYNYYNYYYAYKELDYADTKPT